MNDLRSARTTGYHFVKSVLREQELTRKDAERLDTELTQQLIGSLQKAAGSENGAPEAAEVAEGLRLVQTSIVGTPLATPEELLRVERITQEILRELGEKKPLNVLAGAAFRALAEEPNQGAREELIAQMALLASHYEVMIEDESVKYQGPRAGESVRNYVATVELRSAFERKAGELAKGGADPMASEEGRRFLAATEAYLSFIAQHVGFRAESEVYAKIWMQRSAAEFEQGVVESLGKAVALPPSFAARVAETDRAIASAIRELVKTVENPPTTDHYGRENPWAAADAIKNARDQLAWVNMRTGSLPEAMAPEVRAALRSAFIELREHLIEHREAEGTRYVRALLRKDAYTLTERHRLPHDPEEYRRARDIFEKNERLERSLVSVQDLGFVLGVLEGWLTLTTTGNPYPKQIRTVNLEAGGQMSVEDGWDPETLKAPIALLHQILYGYDSTVVPGRPRAPRNTVGLWLETKDRAHVVGSLHFLSDPWIPAKHDLEAFVKQLRRLTDVLDDPRLDMGLGVPERTMIFAPADTPANQLPRESKRLTEAAELVPRIREIITLLSEEKSPRAERLIADLRSLEALATKIAHHPLAHLFVTGESTCFSVEGAFYGVEQRDEHRHEHVSFEAKRLREHLEELDEALNAVTAKPEA